MSITKYNQMEGINVQLGQAGADIVTAAAINQTTNPNTEWVAIQLIVGTTITSATSVDTSLWDNIASLEVPAGTTIYGRWNAITIGSGDTAICYRG
jgi:hypothetical protein